MADARPTALLDQIAADHQINTDFLLGTLAALVPFGAVSLRVSDNGGVLADVPSENAADLIRSLARMIEDEVVIVDDWYRVGAECSDPDVMLDRGVCLLRALEVRRAVKQPSPIRTIRVVKAIVKAATADGRSALLMLLSERSHRFQFVGGSVTPTEDFDIAIVREISEKLPTQSLRIGRDYTVQAVTPEPMREQFVSPTYGSLTEFLVMYYFVSLNTDLVLSSNMRWVELDELRSGVTVDGVQIVPPPEAFRDLERHIQPLAPSTRTVVQTTTVRALPARRPEPFVPLDVSALRIGDFIRHLTPAQLWVTIGAIVTMLIALAVAGFTLGKVFG